MTTTTYPVEHGALVSAPIYNDHKRGKNWLAVIAPDPMAPGGLGRKFQPQARGRYLYMIDGLKVGDAVEFGADHYSGSGNKTPYRWYGVVRSITEESVEFEEFPTSAKAIANATKA